MATTSTTAVVERVRSFAVEVVSACGRGALVRLLLLQATLAVTEGIGLALLVPVIQSLGGADTVTVPATGITVSVVTAFLALILVVCLRACVQWRTAVVANAMQLRTTDALRVSALEAVFAARWEFIAGQRRSHIVQSLTSEVMRAGAALALLTRLVVGTLVVVATAAVAIVLSPVVGGLAVLSLLVVVLVARPTLRASSALGASISGRYRSFGAVVTDSLNSVRLVRAHDAAGGWLDLIEVEARHGREVQGRYVRSSSGVSAVLSVAALGAVLGLVSLGRWLGLETAQLVALAVVAQRLLSSAQTLLTQAQQFANLAPALDGVRSLAAGAREHRELQLAGVASPSGRSPQGGGAVLVRLSDVTVRYDRAADPALVSVDLELPRDGLVVLSGPSGSGKSTLIDVVLGLVSPDAGAVVVDGRPLTDLAGWRARIGYVPQQNVLVPGSVWQNLVWSAVPGRPPTERDAWRALEAACLADVVRALPAGLATELRELTELSGGEQQRLCLARALIREPDLLLLDEATSALDPVTEGRVLDRLAERPGLTLLVSHRPPSTLRAVQRLSLRDGRLTMTARSVASSP